MSKTFYKLVIEYDGTEFCGWQLQQNGRTVQFELERALHALFQEKIRVTASGRTDAGVHALGQVVSFSAEKKRGFDVIVSGLNAILPEDVCVRSVEEVGENFHPRFDAISRSYVYKICRYPSAVYRKFCWPLHLSLDVDAMNRCADMVVGEHDFQSFCSSKAEVNHYNCSVKKAYWEFESPELLIFRITANRFLHNMVRILVGTMIEVGRGKNSVEQFADILSAKDRKIAGPTAPAHGLFLVEVAY